MINNLSIFETVTNRLLSFLGCTILAAITPTSPFVLCVTLACFFNIWCGMRADGVINIRCRNWSWRKFLHSMAEFMVFLGIIEIIAIITHTMGDKEAGLYACKTAAYCIIYVYLDNAAKNLCKAYPDSRGLWLIYLFVHLDFKRIVKIDELMDKYEQHIKRQETNNGFQIEDWQKQTTDSK